MSGEQYVPEQRIKYKFNEDELIWQFKKYIDTTYSGHYARNKFQSTEFIIDNGHGVGFMVGNVMKYVQRYGKKGTREDHRKDVMKVLHYALMLLYVHDLVDSEDVGKELHEKVFYSIEAQEHLIDELTKKF